MLDISFAGERAEVLGDCAVEVEAVAAPALPNKKHTKDGSSQRRGEGVTVNFLK